MAVLGASRSFGLASITQRAWHFPRLTALHRDPMRMVFGGLAILVTRRGDGRPIGFAPPAFTGFAFLEPYVMLLI
jgi:hypothetical protein